MGIIARSAITAEVRADVVRLGSLGSIGLPASRKPLRLLLIGSY
jgi:hypothetical protein